MLRRWLDSEQPIGCSFTKRHVRLAQVTGWHSGFPKVTCRQQELTAECSENTERRKATLPRIIRDMLKSADFRGRAAVSSLPPDQVWYRNMRLAPMPDHELTTAAHWVAAKELGAGADAFKSQALRIGTVREADLEKVEVVCVGANLKVLEEHAAVLARAGLVPVAIDAAPCAAARLLTGRPAEGGAREEEALLIIDIGCGGSAVVVAANAEVRFLHNVSGGLARVADLLAQRLGVPAAAARELLASCGGGDGDAAQPAAGPPREISDDALSEGRADAWRMFGRELAREVSRSLDHYCELLGGLMPSAGTVIGSAAADPAFAEAFADLTGVPVRQATDVLTAPQLKAIGVPPEQLGGWVVPAGLSFYHGTAAAKGKAS
jgi:Tfp pilus assembly PilM family ATPase